MPRYIVTANIIIDAPTAQQAVSRVAHLAPLDDDGEPYGDVFVEVMRDDGSEPDFRPISATGETFDIPPTPMTTLYQCARSYSVRPVPALLEQLAEVARLGVG